MTSCCMTSNASGETLIFGVIAQVRLKLTADRLGIAGDSTVQRCELRRFRRGLLAGICEVLIRRNRYRSEEQAEEHERAFKGDGHVFRPPLLLSKRLR
jgi:hypothetical protein